MNQPQPFAAYSPEPVYSPAITTRLTALWALSEAMLGGVLHAFRLPLTGLIIGSSAVIFIILLGTLDRRPGNILKATFLVMAVKAMVSPHVPVNAYLAILFQGLSGELFFRFLARQPAAVLTGIFSLLQSALQKILVLTLVFGMNLWASVDVFVTYILQQFILPAAPEKPLSISLILILVYIFIHLAAGIMAALLGLRLLGRIKNYNGIIAPVTGNVFVPESNKNKSKKRFRKKLSWLLLGGMSLSMLILSYLVPIFGKDQGGAALIMIIRSAGIMLLWYIWLAPLMLRLVKKLLHRRQTLYWQDIYTIMEIFPVLRQMTVQSWMETKNRSLPGRMILFPENLLIRLLHTNQDLLN